MRELPLFPLHSVLCPGIALPLHIFEPRYREMVGDCLETGSPFGVVLIREGREAGPPAAHIADVGTTAVIRQAGRYPDGRMDIVTVGVTRFRVGSIDRVSQAYLMATVEELGEPVGGSETEADALATAVGRRFLAYLEMLQPDGAPVAPGDTGDVPGDLPREVPDDPAVALPIAALAADEVSPEDSEDGAPGIDTVDGPARHAQLLASARRLIAEGDATAVSYLLTGLVQLDLVARQALLEASDTLSRLRRLEAHLDREQHLLARRLRPMALDLRSLAQRRN